jgi:hypothetical protein
MFWKKFFFLHLFFFCLRSVAQEPFDKAMVFDGNQTYFEIPDTTYLNLSEGTDITIEFWFKENTDDPFMLINKIEKNNEMYPFTQFYGWLLWMNCRRYENPPPLGPDTSRHSPGMIYVMGNWPKQGGGSHGSGHGQSSNVVPGEWNHLAITILQGGNIYFYLNTEYQFDCDFEYLNRIYGSVFIGGYATEFETIFQAMYFQGLVDELRIWNSARTPAELMSTMYDTLGPDIYQSPTSGLIGYYRFDQLVNLGVGGDGLSNDIRDLCYNSNHGNIHGNPALDQTDILTSVPSLAVNVPEHFNLAQNYPNPFNTNTKIRFALPQKSHVQINVYNILGQKVVILVFKEELPPGSYEKIWNGKDNNGRQISSGLYVYRMQAGDFVDTKKMIVVR